MKKILVLMVAVWVFISCMPAGDNWNDPPDTYVRKCKDVELEGHMRHKHRRWKRVERVLKRCKVCDWDGNCRWEDRGYK